MTEPEYVFGDLNIFDASTVTFAAPLYVEGNVKIGPSGIMDLKMPTPDIDPGNENQKRVFIEGSVVLTLSAKILITEPKPSETIIGGDLNLTMGTVIETTTEANITIGGCARFDGTFNFNAGKLAVTPGNPATVAPVRLHFIITLNRALTSS